jgi:hypothetical protein
MNPPITLILAALASLLSGGNLLFLFKLVFDAGKMAQRVETLEKQESQEIPVAQMMVKLDYLTQQVMVLTDDFKEMRGRQCTFSGQCALMKQTTHNGD